MISVNLIREPVATNRKPLGTLKRCWKLLVVLTGTVSPDGFGF
jgi:hypothetical protein